MMDGAGWAMGAGGWLWMVLVTVVALAILGALIWLAVSAATGRRSPADEPAQILAARFARGEITEAEYEQARRLLGVG